MKILTLTFEQFLNDFYGTKNQFIFLLTFHALVNHCNFNVLIIGMIIDIHFSIKIIHFSSDFIGFMLLEITK